MNLLIVSAYIYDDKKNINTYKTGLAILVSNICRNFSNEIDVDIFTTSLRLPYTDLGYGRVLSSSYMRLIYNFIASRRVKIESVNIEKINLHKIYNNLTAKLCCDYISDKKYDVINVHDLSRKNIKILKWCNDKDVPCILTMHIYIGKNYDKNINGYDGLYYQELEAFKLKNIIFSVVSSGMKNRILNDYPDIDPNRIFVIPNGTDRVGNKLNRVITKVDKTDVDKKIKTLLCVGTVNKRKNQIQIIDALKILPIKVRNQIKVIFVGSDAMNGALQKLIKDTNLQDVAEYVGEVKSNQMSDFYKKSFAVISTSLNEAFGLSFIEGFCYGKPSIFFKDIDAFNELYSRDAVVPINDHDVNSIAKAIMFMISNTWDSDLIIEHSKKFQIKVCSEKYEEMYKKVLNDKWR